MLLWDLSLGSQLKALDRGEDVTDLAFAPNEQWLAVGTLSGQIFLVDMTGPELSGRTFTGHTDAVFDLAFSLDGTAFIWRISGDVFGRQLNKRTNVPSSQVGFHTLLLEGVSHGRFEANDRCWMACVPVFSPFWVYAARPFPREHP